MSEESVPAALLLDIRAFSVKNTSKKKIKDDIMYYLICLHLQI